MLRAQAAAPRLRDMEAAVPVLTGDPTTRVADFLSAEDDGSIDEMSDEAIVRAAGRESYKTGIILMRRIQARR